MQNKCFLWSCLWILNRSTLFHAYPSHDVACNNSSKSLGSDAYYQKVERTHPWIHYLCIKNFNVIDWKCVRNHLWLILQPICHTSLILPERLDKSLAILHFRNWCKTVASKTTLWQTTPQIWEAPLPKIPKILCKTSYQWVWICKHRSSIQYFVGKLRIS